MDFDRTVCANKVIAIQYSLENGAGQPIRNAGNAPVQYVHGRGTLFPKLEAALDGKKVGDIVRVKLLPDDGAGRRDPDLVQEVPLGDIPAGEDIRVGGQLTGTDANGNEVAFRITAIRDGTVHLDGNNPLAGQTLVFEVEIQGVRDATAEEIEAGSVNSG